MRILASFDDLDPVAWANGAGETTELVLLGDSQTLTPTRRPWRLSIARLERPGPFSRLPGMTRTFLPTAEVALQIGENVHRARPQFPLSFSGEQETSLIELAAPCFAINLMVAEDDPHGRAGLEMTVRPGVDEAGSTRASPCASGREGPCFALTLEAASGLARFQLLELTGTDVLPDGLGAVLLVG